MADPQTTPHAVFVNAMDTNPLAPSPEIVFKENEEAFQQGMVCVARLTEGKTYLCREKKSEITAAPYTGVELEEFTGPHPAGTVGLQIHLVDPVHRDKTVWHVDYQDVIAIGKLFMTGELDVTPRHLPCRTCRGKAPACSARASALRRTT